MDDKEESKPTDRKYIVDEMIDTNEKESTMPQATQRSKVGSNDVNTTPLDINFM
jgi:hypothetical protein